ncbi:MAG: hypothetical protein AMK71_09465 [Nitrospira bacterium SG8_35_4]|nr:MAG: hypothetical protein AMK71_09465 [Nitrospira bacterium SG8_35_4]
MNANNLKKGICILVILMAIVLISGMARAAGQSSANYTVESDVVSAGGGEASSTNYTAEHTTGQPSIGESGSANYLNYAGFWHTVSAGPSGLDSDGDGIPDSIDNCDNTQNPGQQDTDGDGYGNRCDCDLDNDGVVGFNDYNLFGGAWGSSSSSANWNPDADFDSDGVVGFNDYNIFGTWWGTSAPW